MKKYVFLTMNIGGINGAEQYIYNKMNYLKKQGWQVFIFSGRNEAILIDGFREYEKYIRPALRFYPYCLRKTEFLKELDWICSEIDLQENDSCVIESSNVISSLWGEYIAKKLNCRHLVIIMQERHNYHQMLRSFLEFKLQRHELAGIFEDSVSRMLKEPELPFRPDMRVRAYCNNVVQDCEDHFSKLFNKNADYTFGSIGRLEKPYVPILIEKLVSYFANHPEKQYNLLLIGGCADQRRVEEIQQKIGQCKNVTLVRTNALYPIPRRLVRNVDVFISAAGSSSVSYYEKVPTIKIHQVTAEPIGIFGHDIHLGESVSNVTLENGTLQDFIDQIVEGSLDISYIDDFEKEYYEKMYAEFSRHLHFGEECQEKEYFDTLAIQYTAPMYKVCRVLCLIFGTTITYRLLELIRKRVRGADD